MRKRKRKRVIGLMLREQAESGQRTHGQSPATAWIVLKVVNGEKFISLGEVVIESQSRKISREQSGYVSDKASQPAVGRTERRRRIRMWIVPIDDIHGDRIEKTCRNAEPTARATCKKRVAGQLSRCQ